MEQRWRAGGNSAGPVKKQAAAGRWLRLVLWLWPAALPAQAPIRYQPEQFTCARYQEDIRSEIELQARRERSHESAGRRGILVVRGRVGDSIILLEAWFDSLALWREGAGERISPDTDGLVGGRYRGELTPTGGIVTHVLPFFPDEVQAVADLTGALEQLLPPLPPVGLTPGGAWRDSVGTVILRMRDGVIGGRLVQRYRLVRRLDREESRLLPDSTEVRATRSESETGVFSWAQEVGLVRWEREITNEVKVPVGGIVKQPFRTRIVQKVVVERLAGDGC